MRLGIPQGLHRLDVEVSADRLVGRFTGPAPVADPAAAVRAALQTPFQYPSLRRALTPEDHIAVLVDESLPDLPALLVAILDHVLEAGVAAEAISVLCPPGATQNWIDELPERLEDVHVEDHDPKDRRRLSYLATTVAGRRLYLNRTAVDADQLIVLTQRRYDPCLGYGGAEGDLFPALGDEATRNEFAARVDTDVPGAEPWPARREAIEVTWLLGQPFFVQLIAAAGDGIAHVVAGAVDACREGERLLDASWKVSMPRRADLVLASLSGDPRRHTFADLASAALCAARVVAPGGRVALLADAAPVLGPGSEVLLAADEPRLALAALHKAALPGSAAAVLWAHAAGEARLSVLGGWPGATVEELFATPLADASQVQRLISAANSCLVLEDAHRMMAVD
jgi:nickel-dependent lactate racemase